MWRITGIRSLSIAAAIALLTVPIAEAKKAPEPTAGPIPLQVLTGKRVFISYRETDAGPGAPDLTYNQFYALMKSWGKYELASAPADEHVQSSSRETARCKVLQFLTDRVGRHSST